MRSLVLLGFLLILFACTSEEDPVPKTVNFSVLINGDLFIPDQTGRASYYDHRLGFGAIDSVDRINDGERYQLFFDIVNPKLGTNTVSNSLNGSTILLYRWIGRQGQGFWATSGDFELTEFDTLAGRFSATFNCVFDYPDSDMFFELTQGQLNDFVLSDLFCEPDISFGIPDSISFFNTWGMVGFENPDGTYQYPPCDTESYLKITQNAENESMVDITGSAPINSFRISHEIIDNNKFVTSSIATTRVGGSQWALDYEDDIIEFLENDTITFSVINDKLILSNTTCEEQMVFRTVKL